MLLINLAISHEHAFSVIEAYSTVYSNFLFYYLALWLNGHTCEPFHS